MKRDYIVLFVLNAAGMILELVASRLMSPYFGNSNYVWTAIIGIILLAGSLGNLIGGKISTHKKARFITSLLLIFAAIYLATTPLIGAPILESIKTSSSSIQITSVVSSIVFFLIPATILGITTPIIMKDRISHNKNKGQESGRITAIIATGSLVGTFTGGFWLIPFFGTKMIFVLLAFTILICVQLFKPISEVKKQKSLLIIFGILFMLGLTLTIVSFIKTPNINEDKISIDTEYGRIIIEDTRNNEGSEIRYYKQSGAYSSATYLDEDRRFELVQKYLKKYDEMFKFLDVKQTAMIGGAAYQYPKYYISHFKDKKMDVIEIDPASTEIAKKYFYLDELIEKYDSGDEKRLGLYNDDGRIFLSKTTNRYDAVLNDAFSGEVPVATLTTKEAAETIKNSLKKDGVYMSNILSAVNGDKGRFLRSEVLTLRKVFKHVYVIPVHTDASLSKFTNWMIIATDNSSYKPKHLVEFKMKGDEIELTDDYNPVDSLISTYYFEDEE